MDSNLDWVEQEDSYDPNVEREEYIKEMKSKGFEIVIPSDNELQIDIDTDEQYERFNFMWPKFCDNFHFAKYTMNPSRNGLPGRHITVTVDDRVTNFSDDERIGWQAILGSDPLRELLSMVRFRRGDEYPTLFVEKQ